MRRLGLIGAGGMVDTVLEALAGNLREPLDHLSVLVLPETLTAARPLLARHQGQIARETVIHVDRDAFLADRPELVAECAGHAAVRQHGEAVLRAGCDLIVISTGALSDDALRAALENAALAGGGRMVVGSGSIGAMDALVAARMSGLREVLYTGRKPPLAWRGTRAETLIDLGALTEAATFFVGSARDASREYPQNANVAATLALAGAGFDATRVRLVADPAVHMNVHEVTVRSACTDFTIRLEGKPSASNPKTSMTAGFSVAREIVNRALSVAI